MTAPAEDEVVALASELIAIDTTNTGEPEGTVGERAAAEYVAGKLAEVGYEVEVLDRHEDGRLAAVAVEEEQPQGAVPQRGRDQALDRASDVVVGQQGR